MKEIINDMLQHVTVGGFFDVIKVTGTKDQTKLSSFGDDNSIIMNATIHDPVTEWEGTFGFRDLQYLTGLMKLFGDDVKLSIKREDVRGEVIPTQLEIKSNNGSSGTYRFANPEILKKVFTSDFSDDRYTIRIDLNKENIDEFSRVCSVNSSEEVFSLSSDGTKLFVEAGGIAGSGNVIKYLFSDEADGKLVKKRDWPIKPMISALKMAQSGTAKLKIVDGGPICVNVDSGLINYDIFIIPKGM